MCNSSKSKSVHPKYSLENENFHSWNNTVVKQQSIFMPSVNKNKGLQNACLWQKIDGYNITQKQMILMKIY